MKRYNTPHRHRVIKTRLTEEEYTEFSERVTLCQMSQSEYIRQALIKSRIHPVITVSPVNDELLSAVGKLTAEYGKIGGNLNQIARCLNEYDHIKVYEGGNISVKFKYADEFRRIAEYIELNSPMVTGAAG